MNLLRFQIGVPPFRIDLLQSIDGVSFDEAWKDRIEALVEGEVPAHIISRHHLIQNKVATGRARDLVDVEAMKEAALQMETAANTFAVEGTDSIPEPRD